MSGARRPVRVLVVDDEQPALDELAYLLGRDERVSTVHTALSAADALRQLQEHDVDAVFSDIRMPGLDGVELAQVLRRFQQPPKVVFVTAHEDHAVQAFELDVVDYLLKPVRESRLAEAVRRVCEQPAEEPDDDVIPVESGGVTRFVRRHDVRYVEAQGDYARLHTPAGSPLVKASLTGLAEDWGELGFVRVHRSYLVALAHVDEVRAEGSGLTVVVDGVALPVSRRHARRLRDLLVRHQGPAGGGR